MLKPAIFSEGHSKEAPFLLSLPFMLHCRCTLILDANAEVGLRLRSEKYQFDIPCCLGSSGALRIPIQQFTASMFEHLGHHRKPRDGEYELMQTEELVRKPASRFKTLGSTRPYIEHAADYPEQALPCGGEQPGSTTSVAMKFMMLVGHTMQHRVLQHLQVPGPRGMMYRQIIQGAELLTIEELDRLVGALGSRLEERSLRAVAPETKARGPSPGQSSTGSWAKVSTTSENAEPSMTRSVLATMWELPQDLDYNREAPECDCGEKCRIHVSKTSQDWDRLFWRCPNNREKQCPFFLWLDRQPAWPPRQGSSSADRPDGYPPQHQRDCPHLRISRAGTNHFMEMETCRDCGRIVKDERKVEMASSGRKTSQAPSTPQSRLSNESYANSRDYQEFMRWKQSRARSPVYPEEMTVPTTPEEEFFSIETPPQATSSRPSAGRRNRGSKD